MSEPAVSNVRAAADMQQAIHAMQVIGHENHFPIVSEKKSTTR